MTFKKRNPEYSKIILSNKKKIITCCIKTKVFENIKSNYNENTINEIVRFWEWRIDCIAKTIETWDRFTDNCVVVQFTNKLIYNKFSMQNILLMWSTFRKCFLNVLNDVILLDIDEIQYITWIFDKNMQDIIKIYDIINSERDLLLDQYKKCIDISSISSKSDKYWTIIYVNENFVKISWYTRDELLWKPHNIIRHPDTPKSVFEEMRKKINNWKYRKWIIKNKKKDWSHYRVSATVVPILNNDWEVVEHISVRQDITRYIDELNKINQNLQTEKEKADKISWEKTRLVNIVTHDLRTPLWTIRWYLSMILDWDLWEVSNNIKTYLKKIYDSTSSLLTFINDILDLRKLESWSTDFYFEDINIFEYISDLVFELEYQYKTKKISVNIHNSCNKLIYNTDKIRFRQIIYNLLSNAIKYNDEYWKIDIYINNDSDNLEIIVQDNWYWISKENLPRIFDEFSQIKNKKTKNIVWTWLWLPIVKLIVEKLWWTIFVESDDWVWSKFIVKLPYKNTF